MYRALRNYSIVRKRDAAATVRASQPWRAGPGRRTFEGTRKLPVLAAAKHRAHRKAVLAALLGEAGHSSPKPERLARVAGHPLEQHQ
jgi:hypothetical protein